MLTYYTYKWNFFSQLTYLYINSIILIKLFNSYSTLQMSIYDYYIIYILI